jgi:peroxiredoxin
MMAAPMPITAPVRSHTRVPLLYALLGIFALILLTAIGLAVRNAAPTHSGTGPVGSGQLARGQFPPDFTAKTFDGKTLTLSSLRGKPVLLNFFASWCTSCRDELPAIEEAYRAHKGEGFTVVGINTLENGDGVAFYRQLSLTFPAVADPGMPGKIGIAYHVTAGLPVSVFLDSQGRVDLIHLGQLTRNFIEQELQRLQ